jgi:hypothetical protein
MSHVNAALTPRHRLTVARLVVDEAWPISEVAAQVLAEQDKPLDDETVRQLANASAGRASPACRATRHRPVHGAPHPEIGAVEPALARRPCDR